MALKAAIKNISSKELPAGKVESVLVMRRWSLSETHTLNRYTKQLDLGAMKVAQEVEMLVGEYHIGGHMHGTSDTHVDQIAGWKITFDQNGKKTEFLSSSSFDSLNKKAVDAQN